MKQFEFDGERVTIMGSFFSPTERIIVQEYKDEVGVSRMNLADAQSVERKLKLRVVAAINPIIDKRCFFCGKHQSDVFAKLVMREPCTATYHTETCIWRALHDED